jgi:hypothetical protein
MQDSFYRNFISEEDKIVAFIGGGGKSTLMHRLSRDCQSMGKRIIIFSIFPYIAPIDAKVILSPSISAIKTKIESSLKSTKTIYIGKKIHNGIIENFNITDIKKLLNDMPGDHTFIEADSTKGRSISGYNKVPISIFHYVQRYINVVGADALNQQKNLNWIANQDNFWKKKKVIVPMDIGKWIKSHPFFEKLKNKPITSTFYINKVENIYIENLAIPLAKNIKLSGVEKVLIGSVFNSNLLLIK